MAGKAGTKNAAKGIDAFRERMEKSYGAGTLRTGTEALKPYAVMPSGSLLLDDALSTGGFVLGRISEWYGWDDVGKTTMAAILCAEAQKMFPDRFVAYVDMEGKVDLPWFEAHGVDLDRLFLLQPESAEDVADMVSDFLKEKSISLLVVDSIGAMIGRVEMEKRSDEATVAVVARIVTRMVKAATALARKHEPNIVLINQLRAEIGSGPRAGGTTRPGGNALRFQSTTRLKLAYTAEPALKVSMGGDDIEVAREIAITVERNKCGIKGRTVKVKLVSVATDEFGPIGIDQHFEAAQLGEKRGLIKTSGSWYTLPGHEKGLQGIRKVADYLREHPDEFTSLREQLLAMRLDEVTDDLGTPLSGDAAVVETEIEGSTLPGATIFRSVTQGAED